MPKNNDLIKEEYCFDDLKEIVKRLRAPQGCPWDRVQTHESMENCMLEESAEVIQAVRNADMPNLCEELGDVLLQVLMHSQIASENGEFTFEDVVNGVASKLVRRHPHVFYADEHEDEELQPQEGLNKWEAAKKEEKLATGQDTAHELARIPQSLPPVYRMNKVLKKATKLYGDEKISEKDREELQILAKKCIDSDKALTKRLETFINDMEK